MRVGYATEATYVEDGWVAGHPVDGGGPNRDHADLMAAFECGASHLPIARLENIKRDGDLRQEDNIGQWKEGKRLDLRHRANSLAAEDGDGGVAGWWR